MSLSFQQQVDELKKDWATNPRWKGVKRDYSAEDVVRLRGSVNIEHSLARRGAEKLWKLVNEEDFWHGRRSYSTAPRRTQPTGGAPGQLSQS